MKLTDAKNGASACPKCQADWTKPAAVNVFPYEQDGYMAHFRTEQSDIEPGLDATLAGLELSLDEEGLNAIHIRKVECAACGETYTFKDFDIGLWLSDISK